MEEKLSAPADFIKPPLTGKIPCPTLLTPCHFSTSTALPPHPHTQELLQLHPEPHPRLHLHTPVGSSKDRELKAEVEQLREELIERDSTVSRQCVERERLCAELHQIKQKFSQLQVECGIQNEHWENELCKSEEEKRLQSKLHQQVCERHSAELSALTHTNSELQNTLHTVTQEVTSLRRLVEDVTSERDTLKEQLSSVRTAMMEQTEALSKLRCYIGSQSTEEEQHTHIQKLQKEKAALSLSVELLNVRVKSANDILALQEKELGDQQYDPLKKDGAVGLLSLWRQKVFMLLVQLESKDSQLQTEKSHLCGLISTLEQEVQKLQSNIFLLQHNLQDRTAEIQLHNIHTQELEERLNSLSEQNNIIKQSNEIKDKYISDITDSVQRMSVCIGQWEHNFEAAQLKMRVLTQRLSFANTRLDTVHGLLLRRDALQRAQQATSPAEPTATVSCLEGLQLQVDLLSSERDKLSQELKRTPELIENALKELQQQLDKTREELQMCELQLLEAHAHCEEKKRTIVELQTEAHHTQTVLQENLSKVENACDKKVREMESQLNTARREHTKAVVALRQVERAAIRERERERETEQARSEHTLTQITQLQTQLKEKDRECNILLAVIQQKGLVNEYKRMRKAAKTTTQTQHTKPAYLQHTEQQEGSVMSMLGELRSLSTAVILSTDEEEEDEDGR